MYASGRDVPKDIVRSYAWFSLSAAQGYFFAEDMKEGKAYDMTPTQIAEAQKLSRKLLGKYVVPFQKD